MACIERRQTRIRRIRDRNFHVEDREAMADTATTPRSHYSIGKTENFPEHIGQFFQKNSDDPAVQVWFSLFAT